MPLVMCIFVVVLNEWDRVSQETWVEKSCKVFATFIREGVVSCNKGMGAEEL